MSVRGLDERIQALRDVRELGAGRLPEAMLTRLDALLERAGARRALSGDHTVVGLFGATGSGKSSLINALVGAEVARVHVLRPTTSEPLAVTWDAPGAAALLDWLAVRDRRTGSDPLDPRAERVILLDLPDFDSIEATHREIAERFADQVDVLVWVVDPQKYADAVLHTDFIATHARHGAVTIVVLNQIDRLAPDDVRRVTESLRGLLAADGLGRARVLAASAATGAGLGDLRTAIGDLAESRTAAAERLAADVAGIAAELPRAVDGGAARADERVLVDQVAVAAGADTVARAVGASYRGRSAAATGWPVVSWLWRFRADPLRRLGLRPPRRGDRDPAVHRTSLPAMNAGAQARASLAVRAFADATAEPLAEAWRAEVRDAAEAALAELPEELDQAIARTRLPVGGSWWWVPFGVLQWLSIAAALAGVLWLLGFAWLPTIGIRPPEVPVVEGWPVTTLLIVGGVLLGVLLALAAGAIAAAVGASRRRRARKALVAEVREVVRSRVVAPIEAEAERARRYDGAVAAARGSDARRTPR